MESAIRARECSLSDILAPGTELRMPPYQRSYAWETGEVRDLLGDLQLAARGKKVHFIGAVVLVKMADGTFLVVDGQQRLTTLSMIIAVLRDMETDPRLQALGHAMLGDPDRAFLGKSDAWRLTLNHIDNPYFREAIQTEGATLRRDIETDESSNHNRMESNLRFIEKYLKSFSVEERRSLFETIRERVVLVRVSVPDWDGGYDVFRVLNTRGKAPNSHDIVKTEILQKADFDEEEASVYSRAWLDHESTLGGNGLDELLNYIRQIHSRSARGKVSSEFAKSVLSTVDAKTFLDEVMPRYVEAYRIILRGDPDFGAHTDQVRTPLNHLRLLDHQLWKVPALAYLYHHPDDGEGAAKFFQLLERFGYCMMLHATSSSARQKMYSRLTKAILDKKPLYGRGGPFYFSREDQKKIRDRMVGRFGNFAQRRAICLRLNAALEGGETVRPEDDATVEHVLPKAVPEDSFWNTTWPAGSVQRDLSETLGNFVIVPQHVNHAADRKDFRQKKKLFFADGVRVFSLTEDLRHRNTWTPEDVRNRTEELVTILMDAWFADLAP
ncbi:DUF262 domain-containing protein [Henriciella litoralis]|uniref:DUF262 domain-containing protein n=1 Tax=Henriciella litoralis TaxID=568102 RepID=UPI0009FF35D8|nr:DUF262 domain-containing protein [Henriciella litoralis]